MIKYIFVHQEIIVKRFKSCLGFPRNLSHFPSLHRSFIDLEKIENLSRLYRMRSMNAIGYLDFYEPSILPDGSRDASLPSYKLKRCL